MTDPIRAALERLLSVVKPNYTDPDEIVAVVRAINAARAALAHPAPPAERDGDRRPSGYAYRYQSLGGSVIRFNGGGEVNGSRPVEAIPYWLGRPPQPVSPAEGEVASEARYLTKELRDQADDLSPSLELFGLMHRAADLLAQRHPAPVPVNERLPGPEDCLDEGWAWFFSPRVGWRQAVLPVSPAYTYWLPAHALPLPAGEVQP